MEEKRRSKQVAPVSAETKAAIIRNSVQSVGNQPTLSAAEMKKQFVKPIVNEDGKPCAISEIDRIARETNEALDEIVGIAEEIVGEAEDLFSEYKKTVDETLENFNDENQKNADNIASLNEKKQAKTDVTLPTNVKTVSGAISELHGRAEGHAERLTLVEGSAKELKSKASALETAGMLLQEDVASFKANANESIVKLSEQAAVSAEKLAEVESIAKGASVPLDFDDYEQMINAFNKAMPTAYPKSNSIHIVTVNVPDVWISKIVDTYSKYVYVDDAAFEKDLKEKKRVQVGYYLLSALEGQKVNMADYAKKEELMENVKALLDLFPTVQR